MMLKKILQYIVINQDSKFLLGVISVFSILSCLKGVSDTELNDNTYGKPNKRNTADTVNIVNCHLLTEETTFHALMLYMSHLIVIHLTLMDTTFAVIAFSSCSFC